MRNQFQFDFIPPSSLLGVCPHLHVLRLVLYTSSCPRHWFEEKNKNYSALFVFRFLCFFTCAPICDCVCSFRQPTLLQKRLWFFVEEGWIPKLRNSGGVKTKTLMKPNTSWEGDTTLHPSASNALKHIAFLPPKIRFWNLTSQPTRSIRSGLIYGLDLFEWAHAPLARAWSNTDWPFV